MPVGQRVRPGGPASSCSHSVWGWLMRERRAHPRLLQGVQLITGCWHSLLWALGTVPRPLWSGRKHTFTAGPLATFLKLQLCRLSAVWDFSFTGETLLSKHYPLTSPQRPPSTPLDPKLPRSRNRPPCIVSQLPVTKTNSGHPALPLPFDPL